MSKGLEQCDKCDYFISVEEAYQQGFRDALKKISTAMYHQCFECDNGDLQKWESGNWIRYKLFENVMEQVKEQKSE